MDALLVRAGGRVCALPLAAVVETMRPLRVEPLAGAPDFVLGLAIVRGAPVPVVDLGACLSGERGPAGLTRFVTLRLGERRVSVALEAVIGVRSLDRAALEGAPALLGDGRSGAIAAIGRLDRELLLVLDAARILPPAAWDAVEATAPAEPRP